MMAGVNSAPCSASFATATRASRRRLTAISRPTTFGPRSTACSSALLLQTILPTVHKDQQALAGSFLQPSYRVPDQCDRGVPARAIFSKKLRVLLQRGGRDLKTRTPVQPGEVGEQSGAVSGHLRLVVPAVELPQKASAQPACSIVASAAADPVGAALQVALSGWASSHDRVALRRQLVGLLMLVESEE